MQTTAAVLLTGCILCAQDGVAPAPRVEAIAPTKSAAHAEKRKDKYTVKVETAGWVDTGIPLVAGDVLTMTAEGDVKLADGRSAGPEGSARGWRDMLRQFPMPQADAGALVGRVGDSAAAVPFLIGRSATVDVRYSGHLYVRINAPVELFASGSVKLKVQFDRSQKQVNVESHDLAQDLAETLPLQIFAQIPRRVEDEQHRPGDVVNFALIGTEQQVKEVFAHAGWIAVDKSVDDAIVNGLFATLERRAYLAVPMSTLYLFGRPQDMSYARAEAIRVAAVRHHLRVWKTKFTVYGKPLWVGSATHDNGFERDERNGGITHKIDENIDEERDFIRASFEASGGYLSAAYVTPVHPVSKAHTATGGSFHTDGRILVMELN
ncbi:MAG: LssY C-terminal domain-containing protein [Acidobacteria bacterium]|nr:LssY C-terminal domain-containing protein [Acidobacteriota bacterium]